MADETLLTLAADIAFAHVGYNAVAADQLPVLIQSIYTAGWAWSGARSGGRKRELGAALGALLGQRRFHCLPRMREDEDAQAAPLNRS
jgi:hypothetical protein